MAFDEDIIATVWNKAKQVEGYNPDSYRKDVCCEHGRRSGHKELRELALKLATDLGYIRLFNHENQAQINFKGLGVSTLDQIRAKYPTADRLHLCCGHDVCKLLADIFNWSQLNYLDVFAA